MSLFVTPHGIDLNAVGGKVADSLREIEDRLGSDFAIRDFSGFTLNQDQSRYAAKATARVTYNGKPFGIGTINFILFRLGDGTGDKSQYNFDSIPANFTPRAPKPEHAAEMFIADGTFYENHWFPGLNSLTIIRPDLVKLSINHTRWLGGAKLCENRSRWPNRAKFLDFTFIRGQDISETYHATVWDTQNTDNSLTYGKAILQVAGFLPVPKDDRQLRFAREIIQRESRK